MLSRPAIPAARGRPRAPCSPSAEEARQRPFTVQRPHGPARETYNPDEATRYAVEVLCWADERGYTLLAYRRLGPLIDHLELAEQGEQAAAIRLAMDELCGAARARLGKAERRAVYLALRGRPPQLPVPPRPVTPIGISIPRGMQPAGPQPSEISRIFRMPGRNKGPGA